MTNSTFLRIFPTIIITFFIIGCANAQRNNIVQLQDSIIDDVINYSPLVIINFYQSSCSKCEQFATIYEELADQIVYSNPKKYFIGNMDCSVYKGSCLSHQIRVYPTLKYFIYGKAYQYLGKTIKQDIINWMKQSQNKMNNRQKQL